MEKHVIKIKSVEYITHDVLQIETEKPAQISFNSGQATELSINKKGWKTKSSRLHLLYLCGPPPMMEAVEKQLTNPGVAKKAIITEEFQLCINVG